MKKKMQTIYDNLQANPIELAQGQLLIMSNYQLYNSFRLVIKDIEELDFDEFFISVQRLFAAYFSLKTNTLSNQLSFIYSFYQSYLLYEVEDILSALTDTQSAIYDNTFEAKIGMLLAISESLFPNMPDEILDNLVKLTNI